MPSDFKVSYSGVVRGCAQRLPLVAAGPALFHVSCHNNVCVA